MKYEQLFALQDLDEAIVELAQAARGLAQRLEALDGELALRRRQLEAARDAQRKTTAASRLLETEIEALGSRRSDLESRQMKATSLKQLEASKAELVTLAAQVSSKEEALLGLYERLETQRVDAERLSKAVLDLENEMPRRRQEVEQELDRARQTSASKEQARRDLAVAIDAALLLRYEGVRQKVEGMVLCEIDENSCKGCGLPSPMALFNRMRNLRESLFDCHHCGRLLLYTGV